MITKGPYIDDYYTALEYTWFWLISHAIQWFYIIFSLSFSLSVVILI